MKNLLLLAAAAALLAPAANAQAPVHPTPSLQTRAAGTQLTGSFQLLQDLSQNYRAGAWVDTFRITNSRFTAANLPMRILSETTPNGSAWTPTSRKHRRYNALNLVATDTTYSFNATTGAATARIAVAKTYNAAGKITQSLSRFNLAMWQNYGRDTYTYDAGGYLTRLLLEGYAGSYYPASQTLYTNDVQGRPVIIEDQQDNGSGTGWLLAAKDLLTYNASGEVSQVVNQTVPTGGTAYQNFRRESYTYDAVVPTRVVRTLVDAWRNGAWVLVAQNVWTYDVDGNNTVLLTQVATSPTMFVNYYRHLYTYQQVLGTASARTLHAGLSVVPNPTAGQATVQYTLPTAAPVSATVVDALGRPVRAVSAGPQAAGLHTLALPTAALAAGCYSVRLLAGSQSQTVKLVVE